MTYRMISSYCHDMHGTPSGEVCPECRPYLEKSIRQLEACRFKSEGRPFPTCPDCCMSGEDYDFMMSYIRHDAREEDISTGGNATKTIRGVDDISEIMALLHV